jgi:2,3-bisphosphoglycerate-dependent phosphoglycerate mutase
MPRLVLLRHGQSIWNQEGKFTGWTDIDLSPSGREEARAAGRLLRSSGYSFDISYTSVLKRAIRTLWIALEEMDLMWIPVLPSWRLNERCYGALQGLSKVDTEEMYGKEQVHRWRRGFSDRPPFLTREDPRYSRGDPRYAMLKDEEIPLTESLQDTQARVMPIWEEKIAPQLRAGRRVFVAAHGNSLRGLVKHLDGLSEREIEQVELPTGVPLIYELDAELQPARRFYLRGTGEAEKGR